MELTQYRFTTPEGNTFTIHAKTFDKAIIAIRRELGRDARRWERKVVVEDQMEEMK